MRSQHSLDTSLYGKIVIVTGAGGDIGRAIARTLAEEGSWIIAVDVDTKNLGSLAQEARDYEWKLQSVPLDITDLAAVRSTIPAIATELGGIDILVNCAGICPRTALEEVTESEWDHVFAVNLKGVFFLCQAVIPYMKKRKWGRIINISSLAGFVGGIVTSPAYAASKAGVSCLTKSLAKYLAPYNITVNDIAPGTAQTKMTASWPQGEVDQIRASIPLSRLALPSDIANVVRFIASEDSAFITGQSIHVNGGMLMR